MNLLEIKVQSLLTDLFKEAIEGLKKNQFNSVENRVVNSLGMLTRITQSKELASLQLALMFYSGPFDTYITNLFWDDFKKRKLLEQRLLDSKIVNEGEFVAISNKLYEIDDITEILTSNGTIDEESISDIFEMEVLSIEKRASIYWEVLNVLSQSLPQLQKIATEELGTFYLKLIKALEKGLDNLVKKINDETIKLHMQVFWD